MNTVRQLAKKTFNEETQQVIKKNLNAVGLYTWPTKSYEVWLVLQHLLYLTRPQKLVEFGSGRSTNYLAEYALKFKAPLISFEHSLYYALTANLCLKLSFLPTRIVKHAPIRGDWYDEKTVAKHLNQFGPFDFLFVDGPSEFNKIINRNSPKFSNIVLPFLRDVRLIVVDDVHREAVNALAWDLTKRYHLKRYDINYNQTNTLAFLLNEDYSPELLKLNSNLADLLVPVS